VQPKRIPPLLQTTSPSQADLPLVTDVLVRIQTTQLVRPSMASTLVAPRSAVAAGLSAYRRGLATAAEPYDVAVIGGGALCLTMQGKLI
jgi:hypothetical protein